MKHIKIVLLLSVLTLVFCNKPKNEKPIQNTDKIKSDKVDNKNQYSQEDIKKAIELNQADFVNYIDSTKNINKFYQFEMHNSYTILGYCCKFGRYDFVKRIILKKGDISLGKEDDMYASDALYIAIESQNEKLVNLLLENKAKVNSIYSESGLAPLALACKFPNFQIIETLINHNADIKGNYDRETNMACFPVLEATMSKNKKAIKLLIEKGADINQGDLEDTSALSYAKANDEELYNYLLEIANANSNIEVQKL